MEAVQKSLEWRKERLGQFNASEIGALMTKGRAKDQLFGATAMSLIYKVAAERLMLEEVKDAYIEATNISTYATNWGTEHEAEARNAYCGISGEFVSECGSRQHPDFPTVSASPDGLVGEDGLVEFKCPYSIERSVTQMLIRSADELKTYNANYYWQVMVQMWVTGRKWCDWVTYDPRLKNPISCIRIMRDEKVMEELETRVRAAEEIGAEVMETLREKKKILYI